MDIKLMCESFDVRAITEGSDKHSLNIKGVEINSLAAALGNFFHVLGYSVLESHVEKICEQYGLLTKQQSDFLREDNARLENELVTIKDEKGKGDGKE